MAEIVRATMLSYFLAAGHPPILVDALIKQATVESGLNPYIVGRSGGCLFQWAGSRRRALLSGSRTCPTLLAQLEFANAELRTTAYRCTLTAPAHLIYATLRKTFGRGARCRT